MTFAALTTLLVVFALGAAAGYLLTNSTAPPPRKPGAKIGDAKIRDAGPAHMETPPRRWDMVDEQGDESFPASDPPGNY